MAILCKILLVLGKVLLGILAVSVFLLLICLFVPICYSIEASIDEANRHPKDFDKADYRFRLYFITLFSSNKKKSRKKKKKDNPGKKKKSRKTKASSRQKSKTKQEDMPVGEASVQAMDETDCKKAAPDNQSADNDRMPEKKKHPKKKNSKSDGIRYFFGELKREENKELLKLLLKETTNLLKHYGPRKGRLTLNYCLGDPANTGYVTGLISCIPLFYRKKVRIFPDFNSDELYIYGDVAIKGHIRLIHGCISAFHILKNKRFRQLLKKRR